MDNKNLTICEVGPRDGLQNEKSPCPTTIKLQLINALVDAGLTCVEATSFVSPKWVPQMGDHKEVVAGLPKTSHVRFPVLVPNLKGLDNAMASGVKEIAVFAAASDSFSLKNINCTVDESIVRLTEVIQKANENQIRVRGYVSCVLGCPYEGEISYDITARVASRLFEAGCSEISLGDTIGIGTPSKAAAMLNAVAKTIPMEYLAIHFHDTYGQALANIYACLGEGVRIIDSSVAGLGGCPYAKGASGNVATEDVLYLAQGLGYKTNIDLDKVILAGKMICDYLKRPNLSKVALAKLAQQHSND